MSRKDRGVTLVEALFALFISSLVMYGLTSTLQSAATVQGHRQQMDEASERYHIFKLISTDLTAQTSMTTPAPGSNDTSLVFVRVDPRKTFLERVSLPSNPKDPYELTEQLEVSYFIASKKLVRKTRVVSESTVNHQVLVDCEELKASSSGHLVSVSLVFPSPKNKITASVEVAIP